MKTNECRIKNGVSRAKKASGNLIEKSETNTLIETSMAHANKASPKSSRKDRQRNVLFGVIEQYLKTGKPVGSQTLQETGFPELSSATIRNYFAALDDEGFLQQHHTSGGRTPLPKAFKIYAQACLEVSLGDHLEADEVLMKGDHTVKKKVPKDIGPDHNSKEVVRFLQESSDEISSHLNAAVFISLPRFDRDGLLEIRYVPLERRQLLAIFLTTYGTVQTEIIPVKRIIRQEEVHALESFSRACLLRAQGGEREVLESMSYEEREFARSIYQEVMARYLVSYSNISEDDLYRTGFSRLLSYSDAKQAHMISSSLYLFENRNTLRGFCREAVSSQKIRFWIGDDLDPFVVGDSGCALITAPYKIGNKCVGAVGVIGPMRMFYKDLFEYLLVESARISEVLTKTLCTHHIELRESPFTAESSTSKKLLQK